MEVLDGVEARVGIRVGDDRKVLDAVLENDGHDDAIDGDCFTEDDAVEGVWSHG